MNLSNLWHVIYLSLNTYCVALQQNWLLRLFFILKNNFTKISSKLQTCGTIFQIINVGANGRIAAITLNYWWVSYPVFIYYTTHTTWTLEWIYNTLLRIPMNRKPSGFLSPFHRRPSIKPKAIKLINQSPSFCPAGSWNISYTIHGTIKYSKLFQWIMRMINLNPKHERT